VPFEACQAHDFATPQAKSRTVATNAPPTRTTSCSALAARSTLWWTAETSPRHQFDEPVDGRLGDCAFQATRPLRSTTILVATSTTWCGLWLMKMKASPDRTRSRT
jgi:hypothetical protein